MIKIMNKNKASFRDPDGFICVEDNKIFRIINESYKPNYELLMQSGLYEELVSKQYLISHSEIETNEFWKKIFPVQVPFISYPYEWSFSQLKDSALLTLKIQRIALKYGMSLKDASAYNIQFLNGKPIFIDTLSFEKYEEGQPWKAYRQFCQHFLAPLLLMQYTDLRLLLTLKNFIDGIPLDLAIKLLPLRAKIRPSIFTNICLQVYFSKKYEDKNIDFKKTANISKEKLLEMNEQLQDLVMSLKFPHADTEWGEYYTFTNYSDNSFKAKADIVSSYIDTIKPQSLWDLGANNGHFTRLASEKGINAYAFDIDPVACEKNYNQIKRNQEKNLLPLLFDLTNPSPSIGFANEERGNLLERNTPDCIMALALIHHIAISNNVPLIMIAEFFSKLAPYCILEFVPKSDSQVKKLLATREDIFPEYTEEGFEKYFFEYYDIIEKNIVGESTRTLYLLKRKK